MFQAGPRGRGRPRDSRQGPRVPTRGPGTGASWKHTPWAEDRTINATRHAAYRDVQWGTARRLPPARSPGMRESGLPPGRPWDTRGAIVAALDTRKGNHHMSWMRRA